MPRTPGGQFAELAVDGVVLVLAERDQVDRRDEDAHRAGNQLPDGEDLLAVGHPLRPETDRGRENHAPSQTKGQLANSSQWKDPAQRGLPAPYGHRVGGFAVNASGSRGVSEQPTAVSRRV